MTALRVQADRLRALRLAPDGSARPHAPFGRGPLAARVLGVVIGGAARAGASLPPARAHRLAVLAGTAEWALRRSKRRVLAANLARAAPQADRASLRRLVRAEVINEVRRSADLLWSLGRPDELLAGVRVENGDPVRRLLASGRGVILAGPHIGGWEIVGPLPSALIGIRATVIVTDDWLAWAMERFRSGSGLHVVYASRPPRTVSVRMLDCDLELPAGPATLARLGDAPIVPLAVLPIAPRAWRIVLGDPIEPPARADGRAGEQRVMQRLADGWTEWLRRHPEHWAAVYPLPWRPPPAGASDGPRS